MSLIASVTFDNAVRMCLFGIVSSNKQIEGGLGPLLLLPQHRTVT